LAFRVGNHATFHTLEREVRKVWRPRVRAAARKGAATTAGITIEARARFGYTAPIGTTDDPRMRRLTVHLPPAWATRLLTAQEQGVGHQQLSRIVAEGLQEVYFKDNSSRTAGLEVELAHIDFFDAAGPCAYGARPAPMRERSLLTW
jgi:hypothetical protein